MYMQLHCTLQSKFWEYKKWTAYLADLDFLSGPWSTILPAWGELYKFWEKGACHHFILDVGCIPICELWDIEVIEEGVLLNIHIPRDTVCSVSPIWGMILDPQMLNDLCERYRQLTVQLKNTSQNDTDMITTIDPIILAIYYTVLYLHCMLNRLLKFWRGNKSSIACREWAWTLTALALLV